ncbi:GIY-YIG nuclease family protein [Candidatus Dehalogenimonas loeffleri]
MATMREKTFTVYIMASELNTVIYIGVTSNLKQRVYQHKAKLADGFTSRYNINKLVYYETCPQAEGAITREKQLKSWSRKRKNDLIEKFNPEWRDLYDEI